MTDRFSPERRSWLMSRVRGKGTKPELAVRTLLRGWGRRCRLHPSALPGRPDIVLAAERKAIFVHGCFWHRHKACGARMPKSNVAYWKAKLRRNVERDRRATRKLRRMGWGVLVVWECELARPAAAERIRRFVMRRAAR